MRYSRTASRYSRSTSAGSGFTPRVAIPCSIARSRESFICSTAPRKSGEASSCISRASCATSRAAMSRSSDGLKSMPGAFAGAGVFGERER